MGEEFIVLLRMGKSRPCLYSEGNRSECEIEEGMELSR